MIFLNKDCIFAISSLVMALVIGFVSFSYPADSALFPSSLAVIMGGLAIILLARKTVFAKNVQQPAVMTSQQDASCDVESGVSDKQAFLSAVLVFFSIVIYSLLMKIVNYEVATVVFLSVLMLILKFSGKKWIIVIALGLMGLLWGIFFHLLGVTRPESMFWG